MWCRGKNHQKQQDKNFDDSVT